MILRSLVLMHYQHMIDRDATMAELHSITAERNKKLKDGKHKNLTKREVIHEKQFGLQSIYG